MKRYFTFIFFIVLSLLIGCKSSPVNTSNSIDEKVSQISIDAINFDNEEYSIMRATGSNNSMIFLINFGTVNVENIEYWIDHYIDGELTEKVLDMESSLTSSSTSRLYFSISGVDSSQELWTMAIRQDGNVSSGKYQNMNMDFDSTIAQPLGDITSNLDQIIDLGMLVRNKERNNFGSSLDVNKTIDENKEVYVIRCKLV